MSNSNQYASLRENVRFLSILGTILISAKISHDFFALTWIISLILLSNVKKIKVHNSIQSFFRMSGYFIHLGIFTMIWFYQNNLQITTKNNIVFLLVSFFTIYIYYYFNRKLILFNLSDIKIAENTNKQKKYRYFSIVYNQLGAAICEELYFRMFLMNYLFPQFNELSIVISAIYFWLFHYTLLWGAQFKKEDSIKQFLFGFILSIIYYYSGNIFFTILIHTAINLPIGLIQIKLFYRHYINSAYFDDLLLKDDLDDLLI